MNECNWGGHVLDQLEAWSSASAYKPVYGLRRDCYVIECAAIARDTARDTMQRMTVDSVIWVLPRLLHQELRMAKHEGV